MRRLHNRIKFGSAAEAAVKSQSDLMEPPPAPLLHIMQILVSLAPSLRELSAGLSEYNRRHLLLLSISSAGRKYMILSKNTRDHNFAFCALHSLA